jgi:hypothetical protein
MSDELDPQLPPGLVRELNELHRIDVPATIDASVLLRSRATIARNHRRRRLLQWAGAAASAAAAIVLAITILHDRRPAQAPPSVALRQDLDGNGRVDILDAFWLARKLDKGASQAAAWDINGDGKVDQADVDSIAASAVRVGGKS